MLLTFPQLLAFSLLAPLALRLALAAFFIVAGITNLARGRDEAADRAVRETLRVPLRHSARYAGVVECVLGVLFVLGLFTQIAAILAMVYAVKMIVAREVSEKLHVFARYDLLTYVFIFACSLAVLIAGPGAFGIDLPL